MLGSQKNLTWRLHRIKYTQTKECQCATVISMEPLFNDNNNEIKTFIVVNQCHYKQLLSSDSYQDYLWLLEVSSVRQAVPGIIFHHGKFPKIIAIILGNFLSNNTPFISSRVHEPVRNNKSKRTKSIWSYRVSQKERHRNFES